MKVKTSPEGDVIEFVDGPYTGEQLFKSYGKHIKKTLEDGKRFPTRDEWNQLIHSMPYNELIEKFNIKLIGIYEESESKILGNLCNFKKSNQETQFWYKNLRIPHISPSRTIWFGADQCGYFNDGNGSYDNYCSIRFTDRNLAKEHIAELKYYNDVVSDFFKEVIKDFLKK